MARSELTVTVLGGTKDPDNPVLVTQNSGDSTNNHYWDFQPNDIVKVRNDGTSAIQATLKGVADQQGRSADIQQSIAAGAEYVWGPLAREAWEQSGQQGWLDVDTDTDPQISVERIAGVLN